MTLYKYDDTYMEWRLQQPSLNNIYSPLDMSRLPPYRLVRLMNDDKCRFRFNNVWDEETERKIAADKQAAQIARANTRETQTKSTKMRRPFCKFCMDRGFPLKQCKTHYTKSSPEFGATITCPELLKQQCGRCGEYGHTPTYCKSEFWLKTDPRKITTPPKNLKDHFYPFMINEENIKDWQQPIPPGFQEAFDAYQEKYVKTSRVWIEMTGDHTKYTNNYRLCCHFDPKNGYESFSVRPETHYEIFVQYHYKWMRIIDFEPNVKATATTSPVAVTNPPTTTVQPIQEIFEAETDSNK